MWLTLILSQQIPWLAEGEPLAGDLGGQPGRKWWQPDQRDCKGKVFASTNIIINAVCGLRSNKRPKEDPAATNNQQKKRKKPSEKKKEMKKKVSKKKKRRPRRDAAKKKGKKGKEKKRQGNTERQEVEDDSSKRTAVIWPWLTSITVSGEVVCAGHIISPRQD